MPLSRKVKTERLKRRALILGEVHEELDLATKKSPPMNSALFASRKEAIQVAAMAIRFIEDVCDVPNDESRRNSSK